MPEKLLDNYDENIPKKKILGIKSGLFYKNANRINEDKTIETKRHVNEKDVKIIPKDEQPKSKE